MMKNHNTKKLSVKKQLEAVEANAVAQTNRDFVTAILIVSLLANLFVLTAWVTLQVTTVYDSQVATFLFSR